MNKKLKNKISYIIIILIIIPLLLLLETTYILSLEPDRRLGYLYYYMAYNRFEEGNNKDAELFLDLALEHNPNNSGALNLYKSIKEIEK